MSIRTVDPRMYSGSLIKPNTGAVHPHRTPANWQILQTQFKQERCLARELVRRGIPFYLPLVPRRAVIRGQTIESSVPLFPGYVFVLGTPADEHGLTQTDKVVQVVAVTDGEQLQHDLERIQRLIASGTPLTVETQIDSDRWWRIRAGALQGLEGTLADRRNMPRFIVWVASLQQGASLAIEKELVEPVTPTRW